MSASAKLPKVDETIVRLQIPDGNEWLTIAQSDKAHIQHLIDNYKSEHFEQQLFENIANARSPLIVEQLEYFKHLIDNALFLNAFRIIPHWIEGETA